MIKEITEAAHHLGEVDGVRAVVLKGEGKSFCAGGDLGWMQDQMDADRETRGREAKALAMMLFALNRMPKPLIGCLEGNAFGGGVGMASVCDVAVGVKGLKMGLTEVRLGLTPATIGPYVVARMGEACARRVFMSARLFDAAEAKDLGLLAKVVAPEDMDAAVEAEIKPYLSAAPEAVARAKKLALDLGNSITEATIDHTIAELVECWESDAAREGVSAFFEKRKASWVI
jgi:methylglutaconyl-CoA hydratase